MESSDIVEIDMLNIELEDEIFDDNLDNNLQEWTTDISEKCSCKAGASGCYKHVAGTVYQLVEHKQLNLNSVSADKTRTDVLQKWHIPGEGTKAALKKDTDNTRKFITGSILPMFDFLPQAQ